MASCSRVTTCPPMRARSIDHPCHSKPAFPAYSRWVTCVTARSNASPKRSGKARSRSDPCTSISHEVSRAPVAGEAARPLHRLRSSGRNRVELDNRERGALLQEWLGDRGMPRIQERAVPELVDQLPGDRGPDGRTAVTATESPLPLHDLFADVGRAVDDDRAPLRSIVHPGLHAVQAQRVAVPAVVG